MLRTAARQLAASFEANHQTAIGISKAQGIGQRGFLDGMLASYFRLPPLQMIPLQTTSSSDCSHFKCIDKH
jgi:hypothetical protein